MYTGTNAACLIQEPIDSHYIMKVLVIASDIIKILSAALSTYNSIHYGQYIKTICKTIRLVINSKIGQSADRKADFAPSQYIPENVSILFPIFGNIINLPGRLLKSTGINFQ